MPTEELMSIPYYQVDAFTSALFAGNPAGVCLLTDWLPDATMQSIAMENSLAETAFVVPRGTHFDLRWFTPELEIDLCGHATLASAHVLFTHLAFQGDAVRFETRSGLLTVARKGELLELDFPTRTPQPFDAPEALLRGLGRSPSAVLRSRDILVLFDSEKEVLELRPDMALLATLDCIGVIATAPGEDCDFVSRFFAPQAGVPEDPVTGSAHCTLIPYWAERLGKMQMRARQRSRRGGELLCELRGDRVGIGGRAVTYATGFLHLG